jgi:hypothetical protein
LTKLYSMLQVQHCSDRGSRVEEQTVTQKGSVCVLLLLRSLHPQARPLSRHCEQRSWLYFVFFCFARSFFGFVCLHLVYRTISLGQNSSVGARTR